MSKDTSHIIEPVAVELIEAELNKNTFLRDSSKGGNELYIVNAHNSPNTMQEIGRLRELTFTLAGGGTGKSVDIDEKDTSEHCYQQLIVWSPTDKAITGGYRFIDCSTVLNSCEENLSTAHYFSFSDQFISEFLPTTVELGRSWVNPDFQPHINPRKGMFALDNLFDGLGAITVQYSHIEYFFGKVTMYADFNREARNAVLRFLHHFFPDNLKLVCPHNPLELRSSSAIEEFLSKIQSVDFKEGLKLLAGFCKERDTYIPPLFNSYMNLSSTMKSFGTALNPDFGGVEETGIMIKISDIYEEKKKRYVESFLRN